MTAPGDFVWASIDLPVGSRLREFTAAVNNTSGVARTIGFASQSLDAVGGRQAIAFDYNIRAAERSERGRVLGDYARAEVTPAELLNLMAGGEDLARLTRDLSDLLAGNGCASA